MSRVPDRARRTAARWAAGDVPDQAGRTVVVTGGSAGVGLETARVLARRGATVLLAGRDLGRGHDAAEQIRAGVPQADVQVVELDLARLSSVRAAAVDILSRCPRLDVLINNAGVMAVPYQRTGDGFEPRLAVNHLGHFALTGLLLGRLLAAPGSRVVTVSSIAHRRGEMAFGDLSAPQIKDAYAQSKLANLLFTYELQARLAAAGAPTIALAAHPGNARTGLWLTTSRLERALISRRLRAVNFWAVQSAELGALPVLRAAADPSACGGEYYGPGRWLEATGYPILVPSSARSHDTAAQRRLWQASEQLTGVCYGLAPAVA